MLKRNKEATYVIGLIKIWSTNIVKNPAARSYILPNKQKIRMKNKIAQKVLKKTILK